MIWRKNDKISFADNRVSFFHPCSQIKVSEDGSESKYANKKYSFVVLRFSGQNSVDIPDEQTT